MKKSKKILSVILSFLIASSTFAVVPSAEINMDELPCQITSKKEINDFKKSKPKNLKVSEPDYYYYYYSSGSYISWDKVDNALCYDIYKKEESSNNYILAETTVDNCAFINISEKSAKIFVKAVTYTTADKIVESKGSNVITVKNDYNYYDDYGFVEEEAYADGASQTAVNTITSAMDTGYYESPSNTINPYTYFYEPQNTEEYSSAKESGYKSASTDPVSTFSSDVDTASYANLRRLINSKSEIPEDSVRIEEMLNYFDYNFSESKSSSPFSFTYEFTDCPWNSDNKIMMIGIQGKDLEETPASNLVFLVDVSGSMNSDDKLPLVLESISKLTETMSNKDRISIVTYSGYESVILAGATGNSVNTVEKLSSALSANGSTNGEGGIKAAYDLAEKYYIKGGNNRIILCSDGDLNVGISDTDELVNLITEKRKSGVYLTTLGFGAGNLKDEKMEALADNGNGKYHYIDSAKEAEKVLVEERNSTLYTIAEDVKIQVEFNPENVSSYRLIGYDNRRLDNEDFENDEKDAGDVGAGDNVIVLYEIVPADGGKSSLKYQTSSGNKSEWAEVRVRYKRPGEKKSLITKSVIKGSAYTAPSEIGDRLRFSCAVCEFGLILKDSEYKENASISDVKKLLSGVDTSKIGYSEDFVTLVDKYSKTYLTDSK